MKARTTLIHPDDDVAVAFERLRAGESVTLGGGEICVKDEVAPGHKIAIREILAGKPVIKYGYPIGLAIADIAAGEHVHSHNLRTGLSGEMAYSYAPLLTRPAPRVPGTFSGFRRENGKAGIRNELWIVPTVGCVNSVAAALAQKAQRLVGGTLEGVYSFTHPYGCSQLGDDHENTKKALCSLINHPNAGGVLALGLGCENNTIAGMQAMLGHGDTERVKFLACQDAADEEAAAIAILEKLAAHAARFQREEIPMAELIVGLKCGGSDGLSGITANPLVGAFSDRLIAEGGTTILTEVPEMFGAEQLLLNRCASEGVFKKAVSMINGFKGYFIAHGQPVYENPSPGNKAGGITTLEDKSLGCTQKAGRAPVEDVLGYGEAVRVRGLNLLNAPGNDLVASTALAAAGAHIILFTTGRGTPFGAPVPTIKISSNTALALHKSGWIDFDAGPAADGAPLPALCDALYALVRDTASGSPTKSERQGFRDLAIFKSGVTL